ncbi:uridine diphosphate glucose pyrophosphatase NUDT22-like [Megalops cyprinoides]|uniref:uridine diphosphate glucose pyrophosphatase NUDT22-like n=1 Tax=Megalops cyprinoides TaxID=118141 RepID=UPI0018644CC3|nr:uridine diphosphate glucose pyrophosphatase NUDT22-like [Megalops cyprinoides]XP_036404588.1 uridine diphosphate glucose pyrophosphatase NUDT22-like [Megalops cyprinoides]
MKEVGSACPVDPEASVLLHCGPWKGLREEQVQVELSNRYNRRTVAEVEQHIEEVWAERITQKPWLFNGAKFRLFSASLVPSPSCSTLGGAGNTSHWGCNVRRGGGDAAPMEGCKIGGWREEGCRGSGEVEGGEEVPMRWEVVGQKMQCPPRDARFPTHTEGRASAVPPLYEGGGYASVNCSCRQRGVGATLLTLQLGLTCYKDFLGTNWSRRVGALMARGEAEFGDTQALLAQPLGVGGVLRTSDGLIVLLRRSQKVAEAPGLLDIPGGHPEPKAVCQGVSEDCIRVEQLAERAVVRELFSSVSAEIRDEVNIPLSSLSEPVLLGIALNHTSAGRPSAEFYISCSLSSKEVKDFYWQGGPEAHESTDIVFLSQEEVMQLDESASLWTELCPSAKGAVMLYRLVLPDKDEEGMCSVTNAKSI